MGINKEVLSQDCSYRREAIIHSLLSKAHSFKSFTHPYLTNICFIFINKLFIGIAKQKWKQKELLCPRESDTKAKVQWRFREFHQLASHVSSRRGVRACWFINTPPHSLFPSSLTCTAKGCPSGLLVNPSQGAADPGTPRTAPSWSVRKPNQSASHPTPSYQ